MHDPFTSHVTCHSVRLVQPHKSVWFMVTKSIVVKLPACVDAGDYAL